MITVASAPIRKNKIIVKKKKREKRKEQTDIDRVVLEPNDE